MKPTYTSAHTFILFFSITLLLTACSTSGPSGIFGKKSAHEAYGDKIKNAGLQETALGRQWFAVAEQSLKAPLSVKIPYKETGYFPADKPKALGVIFAAKRGEKLTIDLTKKPATGFAIYLDLWQPETVGDTSPKLLLSADTLSGTLNYEVEKDGNYIIRAQPELLKGGEYTLSVGSGPSLAFPVTPKVKSNIASFWGAGRDAGVRKHEGIDIFAPRRTALVAAANGIVTRVNENSLGGKVIFLRPHNKDYTLYYAHLDEQIAQPGQSVVVGDTLGLMGNTGNAKTTSPHLHFGIYTSGGAIDPLPFIQRAITIPEKITASLINLDKWVRNKKKSAVRASPFAKAGEIARLEANTLMKVEAATGGWYKVSLPSGQQGFLPDENITDASSAIRNVHLKNVQPLLDEPNVLAATKTTLLPGQKISVLAAYEYFYFVTDEKQEGWIPKKAL